MYQKIAAFVGCTLSVCALSAIVYAEEPWTTYQANAAHTGYVPVSLDPAKFSLRWERSLEPGLALDPVTVRDGKVFVSRTKLHVLDTNTGETIWDREFGSVSVNPPSCAYGNVYIQTGHGSNNNPPALLHAYDAETGDFVFQSAFAAQWESYYAPTIYAGKVYIDGGYYGGIYSFDAINGSQDWYEWLPQYDQWTPAVDESYAYAYVGEYSPGLYVFHRTTGTPAFMIPDPNFDWLGWSMRLAPVLGGADDVLAIHDGRLISFDLAEQDIRWELDGWFSGQVSVAKEKIYAISSGALTVRDQITAEPLWGWATVENLIGTMIVTDSHVITRTDDTVYAVSLETHDNDWSYPASGHLAMSEGVLYIAADDGTLIAIDASFADCNGNGVDDGVDISKGTSLDCNENGIPDECDNPCPADLDANGQTDQVDLAILLAFWGPVTVYPDADFNCDGVIDASDLAVLLGTWGSCT